MRYTISEACKIRSWFQNDVENANLTDPNHMKLITLEELPNNAGVYFLEASLRNPGMNPVFYCSIESFHRQNPTREVFVLIPSVNQAFKARKTRVFFKRNESLVSLCRS